MQEYKIQIIIGNSLKKITQTEKTSEKQIISETEKASKEQIVSKIEKVSKEQISEVGNSTEIITEIVTEGTRLEDIAKKYQSYYKDPIVLATFNNKLRELSKTVKCDGTLSFFTMTDRDGKRTYRRSVTILLQKAVYNLWGKQAKVRVFYSLGEGYYCELEGMKLDKIMLLSLKQEMLRLVDADIPLTKQSAKTDTARELFHFSQRYVIMVIDKIASLCVRARLRAKNDKKSSHFNELKK